MKVNIKFMEEKLLVLSTDNINKINEIKNILKDLPIKVLSKKELGIQDIKVKEDGTTLKENAIKKAMGISKEVEGIIVADDTGLFVDYLDGRPGVYSSRYSGEDGSYKKNNEKLLRELDGVSLEKRTAHFETVIAIITENKEIKTVTGRCEGKIGFEPKGSEGFGYDPLFIVDGYGKTFAELGEDIKNNISHRAKALKNLKVELKRQLEDD
ncbi:MAG TPA: XTP/dITP diphosphatase [Tissierellales bacterium]|nr:XTP/dITP diphosphatase [Tissierellales bacterium]